MAVNEKFLIAKKKFEAINGQDPNRIVAEGREWGVVELHAKRLADWIARLNDKPSEALQLAALCQHVRRWDIPRRDYPGGRKGYLRWRSDLARYHAKTAAEVLSGLGYDVQTIERVQTINIKKGRSADAEVQAMEDALCLVFLEFEAAEFAARHADDKVVDILQKTWKKMSERARNEALKLKVSPHLETLLKKAL